MPAPFRVMIVDDEPVARQRVRRVIASEPGVEVVGECGTGKETVLQVQKLKPDLLLLDIQMPELDGFGVLAALPPDRMPRVIFITAFDEHALRAFDVHAVDYVLKPIDADRLLAAVTRARQDHERATSAEHYARLRALLGAWALDPALPAARKGALAAGGVPRFLVKTDGKMFFVNTSDIDWVEADGNYVRLHVGATYHVIRETLAAVERALSPARFARIHRTTIVNLDRITDMHQWSSGDYIVVLTTGARLKLSRTYRQNIESMTR